MTLTKLLKMVLFRGDALVIESAGASYEKRREGEGDEPGPLQECSSCAALAVQKIISRRLGQPTSQL